ITLPVRSMRRNAFGANGALVVRLSRISPRAGKPKPISKPPPIAAVALNLRKLRRDGDTSSLDRVLISCLRTVGGYGRFCRESGRCFLDPSADPWIGAATADVPRHRIIDVRIARVGLCGEQCGGRHDLARLAIAALRHVQCEPGSLNPL